MLDFGQSLVIYGTSTYGSPERGTANVKSINPI